MKQSPTFSSRLQIVPLAFTDLDDIFSLWSDHEAVRNTNWTYTPHLDECAARLKRTIEYYGKNPLHFGPYVIRLSDGCFVGIAGADAMPDEPGRHDLWYFLEKSQRGKGLAKAAVVEILARMKESGRAHQVTATAVVDNPASWGLLESVGFKRQGRIEGGHRKDGLALDLFEYAMALR